MVKREKIQHQCQERFDEVEFLSLLNLLEKKNVFERFFAKFLRLHLKIRVGLENRTVRDEESDDRRSGPLGIDPNVWWESSYCSRLGHSNVESSYRILSFYSRMYPSAKLMRRVVSINT